MAAEFRDLDESAPMSPAQLRKAIAYFEKLLADEQSKATAKTVQAFLEARTKDAGKVAAARRRLADAGMPAERLLQFPAEQLILLDEKREMEVRRDDLMKILNLPTWQVEVLAPDTKKAKEPSLFADALVPSVLVVRRAQGRLEQRIALLRHVEALRLYAADHHGAFPSKLAEISVPLPDDPFTGKPFRYELNGNVAHLRGSPPPGMENEAAYNMHYELTLQKS